jgi:Flp pilus assembly protein TadD
MERMNNHRSGRQCSSSDLEYSRAVAFALLPGSAPRKQLDSSVYLAAKCEGLESELFDLEGEDHDYEIKEEYMVGEEKWRRAIEQNPDNANAWSNIGYCLHNLARYEEAEQAYHKAIALAPDNAYSWNNLGILLKDQARYEEAEHAYRQAIELDPKYSSPWNNLGNLLQNHLIRYEEAEQAYRQAIILTPKNPNLWYGLGNLLQYHLARYDDTEQAYRQAITLAPDDAYPWNGLGNLLHIHLARYEEAEEAYRQAITLNSKFAYPVANLAQLLAQQGKKAEATDYFRKILELADSKNHFLLLQAHCWLGNRDLAIQALNAQAKAASTGDNYMFSLLKEQTRRSYALGLSDFLIDLMNASPYADFLQPFSLALKAANGDAEALLGVVAEIRVMAEEVLQFISATAN